VGGGVAVVRGERTAGLQGEPGLRSERIEARHGFGCGGPIMPVKSAEQGVVFVVERCFRQFDPFEPRGLGGWQQDQAARTGRGVGVQSDRIQHFHPAALVGVANEEGFTGVIIADDGLLVPHADALGGEEKRGATVKKRAGGGEGDAEFAHEPSLVDGPLPLGVRCGAVVANGFCDGELLDWTVPIAGEYRQRGRRAGEVVLPYEGRRQQDAAPVPRRSLQTIGDALVERALDRRPGETGGRRIVSQKVVKVGASGREPRLQRRLGLGHEHPGPVQRAESFVGSAKFLEVTGKHERRRAVLGIRQVVGEQSGHAVIVSERHHCLDRGVDGRAVAGLGIEGVPGAFQCGGMAVRPQEDARAADAHPCEVGSGACLRPFQRLLRPSELAEQRERFRLDAEEIRDFSRRLRSGPADRAKPLEHDGGAATCEQRPKVMMRGACVVGMPSMCANDEPGSSSLSADVIQNSARQHRGVDAGPFLGRAETCDETPGVEEAPGAVDGFNAGRFVVGGFAEDGGRDVAHRGDDFRPGRKECRGFVRTRFPADQRSAQAGGPASVRSG
jgi:hypothetical protein